MVLVHRHVSGSVFSNVPCTTIFTLIHQRHIEEVRRKARIQCKVRIESDQVFWHKGPKCMALCPPYRSFPPPGTPTTPFRTRTPSGSSLCSALPSPAPPPPPTLPDPAPTQPPGTVSPQWPYERSRAAAMAMPSSSTAKPNIPPSLWPCKAGGPDI